MRKKAEDRVIRYVAPRSFRLPFKTTLDLHENPILLSPLSVFRRFRSVPAADREKSRRSPPVRRRPLTEQVNADDDRKASESTELSPIKDQAPK
ncbi:hypothetical protein GWI33_007899 [Rhynchophorus ferrugineus]|uniref:Uncharacterized protein n=1 Tax=Rhynchophorus ferrugineus TaxID=354439 RepID=A0A834MCN6_RHYFE|nr:hypothetical protein GWI33_007899 [Rhynchophorus ferrugineus]